MFSNDETTDRARNAGMRVGLGQFMQPTPERLRYAKQLGVDDVLLNMYAYDPEYPHMPDGEEPALRANGSGRGRTLSNSGSTLRASASG